MNIFTALYIHLAATVLVQFILAFSKMNDLWINSVFFNCDCCSFGLWPISALASLSHFNV
uniref:Uncharacterized protein n=1 Tax=Rhizophora mucronata TaxID=61149 RepID=A0A2P2P1H9_RHIMU